MAGLRHTLLAVVFAVAAGAQAPRVSAFDEGRRLQEQGRYVEAETRYREALRAQPGSAPLWTNLGVVLARQAKFADAIVAYKKALAADPSVTPVKGNIALAYYQQEDWNSAAEWFGQVLRQNPNDRRSMHLLAICDVQRQRYKEAADLFGKLLPSDDPAILVGAATAFLETGRETEGAALLEKLLGVQPDAPQTHFLVGLAHYNREKYAEAAASLLRMLELAPDNAEGRFYLGAVYFRQGNHDAAIAEWRQAAAHRGYFPAQFALGALLSERREYKEATEFLLRAEALRPQSAVVHYELARVAYQEGRYTQALQQASRAVELDPKLQPASFLRANALRQMGREDEAAAEFQRSRRLIRSGGGGDMVDQALEKKPGAPQ